MPERDKVTEAVMKMKSNNLPESASRSQRARLALIALVIAVAALLFFVFPVTDWLTSFSVWSQENRLAGGALLGVLYVGAAVLGAPGLILTLAAGFLFGVVWGTVVVSVGSVVGATAAFLIGRFVARDWVARRIGGSDRFQAIDGAVGRNGFKIVLLTRLSPVFPFNVLNYLFGLTDVRFRDYVLASWIGMLPATVLYVYFGTTIQSIAALIAGEFEGGAGQVALLAGGLAATLLVAVLITRVARRAISEEIPAKARGIDEAARFVGEPNHG